MKSCIIFSLFICGLLLTSGQAFSQDFDSDTVLDATDLDDDNDGILDTEEGCFDFVFPEDFLVPLYHANIVNSDSNRIFVSGQFADPNGTSDICAFTELVPGGPIMDTGGTGSPSCNDGGSTNWPAYSGTNIKLVGADGSDPQYALLTSTNLYTWGNVGELLPSSLISTTGFQSFNFPVGISSADVINMTSGAGILALLTTGGSVYTIGSDEQSGSGNILGSNGNPADANGWTRVQYDPVGAPPVTNLVNVIDIDITHEAAFVVLNNNEWYTWGDSTFNGSGGATPSNVAINLVRPGAFGAADFPQQIEMTAGDGNNATYFALHPSNGMIYSLGGNNQGQVGVSAGADVTIWGNVETSAGNPLTNVEFIGCNSYNRDNPSGSAITLNGGLREIYMWGTNDSNTLSSGLTNPQNFAATPAYDNATYADINAPATIGPEDRNPFRVATGGHLSMYYDTYQQNYAFVGHNTDGAFGATVSNPGLISVSPINPNLVPAARDSDNDGFPDCLDADSDNDGCNDADEAYGVLGTDADGNGFYGTGNPPPINPDGTVSAAPYGVGDTLATVVTIANTDTDSDGLADFCDPDDDNDGNPDATDPNPTTPTATNDLGTVVIGSSVTIDIITNDDYFANGDPSSTGTITITDTGTGTAGGTIVFDPNTGELIYTPLASEGGTTVTIIYEVCNDIAPAGAGPEDVCTQATVTIDVIGDTDGDGITDDVDPDPNDPCDPVQSAGYTGYDATNPIWQAADCDEDGVTNGVEAYTDGTDPYDPCDYDPVSQVIANVGPTWNNADCDGDGVTNGDEILEGTDPLDPCSFGLVNQGTPTSTWNLLDCDGDGVSNGQELIDGTNPLDPCDLVVANQDTTPTTTWNDLDCDGDGVTNGQEVIDGTDPVDPCDYTQASQDYTITTAAWQALDCDGDGVTNGDEVDPDGNGINDGNGTDPQDPCDLVVADQTLPPTAAWLAADCDGDGVTNGDEVTDGTDPVDPCDFMLTSQTLPTTPAWEALDCDGDGVSNGQEIIDGTNPLDSCDLVVANQDTTPTTTWNDLDCDGDGVTNGQEVIDGTDPVDPCDFVLASATLPPTAAWEALDCDGDGVTNGDEIADGTDPQDPCDYVAGSQTTTTSSDWNDLDCDGDGVTNGDEIADGTDPQDPCDFVTGSQTSTTSSDWNDLDCDGDGVTNGDEIADGTDPQDPCDFVTSTQTVTPSNEWNDLDCDGDGVTNGDEIADGTDPQDPCDFITSSQTVTPSNEWNTLDCDGDGVVNGVEIDNGTDPQDPCDFLTLSQTVTPSNEWNDLDCDGDGVTNGDEIADGTDPQDPCDYVDGNQTVATSSDWNDLDCDGDGVTNGDEIADGTDPQDPCDFVTGSQTTTTSSEWNDLDCDGDGVTNGDEIADGTDPQDPCDYVEGSQTLLTSTTWNNLDCDGDGVTNGDELIDGTDPLDPCDFIESSQTLPVISDWYELDCDGDGVNNGDEIADGTDPYDPCSFVQSSQSLPTSSEWDDLDCDGDGVTNGDEIADGTNPLDLCDFELSSQTLSASSQWNDIDCDGDGVTNANEILDGTDPLDVCDFDYTSQTIDPSLVWELADCDCDGQGDGIPNGDETGDNNDNGIPDYLECNNVNVGADDGLQVYDIMTPNGNGLNDVFVIRGIEKYPDNTVKIYNRWGVVVFETRGYGIADNYFRGISNGRVTITETEQLPVGTYYYVLTYVNDDGDEKQLAGPLYINRK